MTKPGRPPATLTYSRRRSLEAAARRVAAAEEKLDEARAGLAAHVSFAIDEGASYRVVGEAIGRNASTVHELAGR